MFPLTMSFTVYAQSELDALMSAVRSTAEQAKPLSEIGQMVRTDTSKKLAATAPAQEPKASAGIPPTATAPESAPTKSVSNSDAEPELPSQPEFTLADAKALITKIVVSKGHETGLELLKKYGARVAAQLAADKIAPFCADAEALLAS